MTYKLTNSAAIIRVSDNSYIPADQENTDYQEYQRWLEEGNMPEPADLMPESVPVDPLEKLRVFLAANPEVVAALPELQV